MKFCKKFITECRTVFTITTNRHKFIINFYSKDQVEQNGFQGLQANHSPCDISATLLMQCQL